MSKNLTRKGLALGTAVAFAVTGLTSVAPAVAAAGDVVSIAPTTGTGYGAYNTDYFNIDTTIDTDVVTSTSYSKLAIKIDSPSGADVTVKLNDGLTMAQINAGADSQYSLPVTLSDANGNTSTATYTSSDVGDASATDAEGADETFTIDFSTTNTSAVIDLVNVDGTSDLKLSLTANDGATATDHKNVSASVTSWIDSDEDEVLEGTDKFPSTTETVTFYDAANVTVTPRIERFVGTSAAYLNGHTDGVMGVSLAFSPALNLDQLVLANGFTFASTGGTDSAVNFTERYLAGNTTHTAAGRIFGTVDAANTANFTLAASTAFTFSAIRANADAAGTGAVTSTTAGYIVPVQATAGITAATDVLVDQTSDSEQSSATDNAVELRSGVKSFKYTLTGTAAAGAVKSNVPVIAQVTATDLAAGSTLTVGSTKLTEGQAVLVSGVTDADGKFSVNVESSSAKAGEDYTVIFRALLSTGAYSTVAAGNTFAATYQDAAATTMAQDASILSGSTVNAKFTLKDQFGKAISAKADGTAYTVRLQAPDTTKLKKYATFVNGEATVSFTNYLAKGQSDTLNAQIGTGLDTAFATASITTGSSLSPVLYNPEDAAGVNVSATLADKPITYDAFITGASSSTNVAPAAADSFEYAGTVVDTTGVGIPGAVVTVSGKGLQFRKDSTGDYSLDSITVAADAAGAFDLQVWAHQVSSTGITITATSGGKSSTTKLTTIANGATGGTANVVTADDLVFTWDAPAKMVVDTTYVVTAKVADKWGNPVKGANVDFSADGAIEVNSNTAVNDKITNDSGIVRVYVRSLEKTTGVGTFTATFDSVTIAGTALNSELDSAEKLENVLSADLDVVTAIAPVATAAASGSTGKFYVSATNAAAKKVVVKVGGVFVKSFTPTTAAKKVVIVLGSKGNKAVTVFIGGKLVLTKTVTIK